MVFDKWFSRTEIDSIDYNEVEMIQQSSARSHDNQEEYRIFSMSYVTIFLL